MVCPPFICLSNFLFFAARADASVGASEASTIWVSRRLLDGPRSRYTRRLRTLVGLSQQGLAERAGVSQGAGSRLEAGRAVNTPLVTVMKIKAAMRLALAALGPGVLSEETQRLVNVPARGTPATGDGFAKVPLTVDPLLGEWVDLFWQVPDRDRQGLLLVLKVLAQVLALSRGRE